MTLRAHGLDVELVLAVVSACVVVLVSVDTREDAVSAVRARQVVGARQLSSLDEVIHSPPGLLLVPVASRSEPATAALAALGTVAISSASVLAVAADVGVPTTPRAVHPEGAPG